MIREENKSEPKVAATDRTLRPKIEARNTISWIQ